MPSTTRSSTSAIRFPSSKQAIAPTSKSNSSSTSKPDAITLLFRREVQSLLSTPPALPSHIPANTPVEVVACVERLSLSGIQQSVQLCQAGDETWVTRTEGARQYFPRAGRVQKRLRGNDEDVEEEERGGVEQTRERVEEDGTDGVTVRRKKSRKSHSRPNETPPNPTSSSSSSSSSRRRRSPAAPQKKKRHGNRHETDREAEEDEDFDDGASTETEHSHLTRTRGSRRTGLLTSIGEEEGAGGGGGTESVQLGRGHRRCAGRNGTPQARPSASDDTEPHVKNEEVDDLASLCGRVGGLEFRSTVDPESEFERSPVPVPVASSSNVTKGKGRA
ncbi:transcriptional repressor WHI5 [Sporobolomyces salmoneus]|uniref:transcriptional repressor WHI5 n=1 Tax=Sporobolomyces salmoneus TaxID=183962 RepID=UPI0031796472